MISISYIQIIIKGFSAPIGKEHHTFLVAFSEHTYMILINICNI